MRGACGAALVATPAESLDTEREHAVATSCSSAKLDDLVRQPRSDNMQSRHRHRQRKSPASRAARVEVEHAVPNFGARGMRMPGYDSRESCGLRVEIQSRELVKHVHAKLADVDDV